MAKRENIPGSDCKAGLLVAVVGREMPFDLHRIVPHAPDADQIGTDEAIEQQMTRLPHDAALVPRPVVAMAHMIASHTRAEFGTGDTADSLRLGGQFAQRNDEQAFLSQLWWARSNRA